MTRKQMKAQILDEIFSLTKDLDKKINTLSALDSDGEDTQFDLHDQLVTFDKAIKQLKGVVIRATSINRGEPKSLGDILQNALDKKENSTSDLIDAATPPNRDNG